MDLEKPKVRKHYLCTDFQVKACQYEQKPLICHEIQTWLQLGLVMTKPLFAYHLLNIFEDVFYLSLQPPVNIKYEKLGY